MPCELYCSNHHTFEMLSWHMTNYTSTVHERPALVFIQGSDILDIFHDGTESVDQIVEPSQGFPDLSLGNEIIRCSSQNEARER